MGGTEQAIHLSNTADGDVVLYSNHGLVEIGNSSTLSALTAYQVITKNTAVLTYTDGLESILFDTGPSGSWDVVDWRETQ